MLSFLVRPKRTGAQRNSISRISDEARRRLETLLLLVGAFAIIATTKIPEDAQPLESLASVLSGRQVLTAAEPRAALRFRLELTGPPSALEGQHAEFTLTGLASPAAVRAEAASGGATASDGVWAADAGAGAPLPLMDEAGATWVRVELRKEPVVEQGGQGGILVLERFTHPLRLALESCDTVGADRVRCVSRAVVELELFGEPAPRGVDWSLGATFDFPHNSSAEGAVGAPAAAPEVTLSLNQEEEGEQL